MDREDLTRLYQFIITVVNVVEIAFYVSVNPGYIEMLFDLPDRLIILLFILGSGILYFLNNLSGYLKKRNPGVYWSIRLILDVFGLNSSINQWMIWKPFFTCVS